MDKEEQVIYPLIVRMNSKEVLLGSVKIKFDNNKTISRTQEEWDVILQEIKIQFKRGDILTKVKSSY